MGVTLFHSLGMQGEVQRTSDGELVAATTNGYQVIDLLHFDNEDSANLAVVTIRTDGVAGTVIWRFDVEKAPAAGNDASTTFTFPNGLHSAKNKNLYIVVTGSTSWKCSALFYKGV